MDFEAIARSIIEAATEALGGGAKLVETRAKARAPVRNIFGRPYVFRQKTVGEWQNDIRFIRSQTLSDMASTGPGNFGETVDWQSYRPTGRRTMQRDWKERRLSRAQQHLETYEDYGDTPLTRRGAYEIRSQRANYYDKRMRATTVGGRLRGEIYSTSPVRTGSGAEAWVISPTSYAKYMEFGTRHNRAHPFLRPALAESRGEVVAMIANAVKQASQQSAGEVEIEIVVRL